MEPKSMEKIEDRGPEANREAKPIQGEPEKVDGEALKRPIEEREREVEQREHGELTEE